MKKVLSLTLTVFMLLSICSSFNVFAEEIYPPLATGENYSINELEKFSYETTGANPEPISLIDSARIQVQRWNRILDLNNETLENQIKEDYVSTVNNKVTVEQLEVQYFGALSDGSLLVYINGPFNYTTVSNYRVIGKYVYVTSASSNDIKIYKNNTFKSIIDEYQYGELSDELLDETAEILHFAKFVNPNEQLVTDETTIPSESIETTDPTTVKSTESTNVEEPTVETTSAPINTEITATTVVSNISTVDTAINKSSNNSVQTGCNNIAIICVIVLVISGVILYITKYKKV